ALDRSFAEHAGERNALAQPDDAGERVDDAKAVKRRPRDQQAAVVGAEVKRRVDDAASIAPLPAIRLRQPAAPRKAMQSLHARGTGGPAPDLVVHLIPARRAEGLRLYEL